MVPITDLILPILISGLFVFIASSLIHMLLPYHKGDYRSLPDEAGAMDALRPFSIPPGCYSMPRPASMKDANSPEYLEKLKKGPVMFLTVLKSGQISMAGSLIMWFVYSVLVSFFAAYVTGRALEAGAHYLAVFRFAGVTSFVAYAFASLPESIWYSRPWSTTLKNAFDGLVYALITAGTFGWLWPSI